jgi:hypothetical protein
MNLELAILLDTEAIQLTWCPKGGQAENYQEVSTSGTDMHTGSEGAIIPRLGLLAVLDTRGRLAIHAIPVPNSFRKAAGINNNDLVFRMSPASNVMPKVLKKFTVKPKSPLLRLDIGTMPVCSFEWANHDMLAVGTTDGGASCA